VPAGGRANETERIEYTLTMPAPASHQFFVRIRASTDGRPMEFQMPAWSPGRYVIYDFARNVHDVSATENGAPLEVVKVDKQTWRVIPLDAGRVDFSYRVFADNLSGTFSQLNERHASINGPSTFMYVVGRKTTPVTLSIVAPRGWRVENGRSQRPDESELDFPNYDLLADTPTEAAPDLDVAEFAVGGRPYRLVTHQLDERKPLKQLASDVRKIAETQHAMLGTPQDLDRYLFLVHLASDADAPDGMEHFNSAVIVEPGELHSRNDDEYRRLLGVISHEHFHLWNGKRLRPAELGPFDYTRENYSTSLWIVEGLTCYYGDLTLARAGILSLDSMLDRFSDEIGILENRPGRSVMSLERASFDTWLFLGVAPRQRTDAMRTTVDYYNKGEIVALLLDLEIRRRTNGERSLDDVMRLLLDRYAYAPDAHPEYAPGRGYRGIDFRSAVNEVAGSDCAGFFAKYVSGTAELDYDAAFKDVGLSLERERRTTSVEYGVRVSTSGSEIVVTAVDDDGPAASIGLRKGDVVLRIDGRPATLASTRELFSKGPQDPAALEVSRDGNTVELLVPEAPSRVVCKLVASDDATPAQKAHRARWLWLDRR